MKMPEVKKLMKEYGEGELLINTGDNTYTLPFSHGSYGFCIKKGIPCVDLGQTVVPVEIIEEIDGY